MLYFTLIVTRGGHFFALVNVKRFKGTCLANILTRALNKRQTDRHTDGTDFMQEGTISISASTG